MCLCPVPPFLHALLKMECELETECILLIGHLRAKKQELAVAKTPAEFGKAQFGVDDVNAAAHALEEITLAVNEISDMAGQIAVAAEEQTQVTNEITRNTVAIKDVTDEITTSATAHLSQAEVLKDRATDLNAKVATFIL